MMDEGTKAAIAEQLALGVELRRKIEGRASGSDTGSESETRCVTGACFVRASVCAVECIGVGGVKVRRVLLCAVLVMEEGCTAAISEQPALDIELGCKIEGYRERHWQRQRNKVRVGSLCRPKCSLCV